MVGYVTVASPLHDRAALDALLAPYRALLSGFGASPVEPEGFGGGPAVVLVGTGGTERATLDVWQRAPREPLILVTHPGHNSLAAALEALARVRQVGGRGRVVHLDGTQDLVGRQELHDVLEDLAVLERLRGLRLGLIGGPSDWLVASSPSPDAVSRTWGPTVVRVPLAELYERVGSDRSQVESEERRAVATTVTTAAVATAAGVHTGLAALVEDLALDAVSVRCFDLIGELGTTGCLALSRLNDAGTVAGCEGDLVSTVGMLWLREVTGRTPWMANPARLDRDAGTLTLAHCTVPLGLVGSHRLDSHFESGQGVGIAGVLPRGPVTLARIGGPELEQLWVVDGELTGTGDDPNLCRTQATVRVGAGALDRLVSAPLGNHLLLVPGHHAARLRRWWELAVAA